MKDQDYICLSTAICNTAPFESCDNKILYRIKKKGSRLPGISVNACVEIKYL